MEKRWKRSLYTYTFDYNQQIILYNTKTKKMAYSHKMDDIKTLLSGEDCEDNLLKNRMLNDGFLVDSECMEEGESMLKYFEQIFDRSLSLIIMPTEQCNFRCRYCYESFENGKMSNDIICGIYRHLQVNLSSYARLNVNWFGGEPLLAMDIIEDLSEKIIRLCEKTHTPYSASITTNGYLLSLDIVKTLIKYKVLSFQITLDGSKEIHNKYRMLTSGAPTFDTILNNLREIRDNISTSRISVIIRVNVTAESLLNIDDFIDNMEVEFGNDNRFRLLLHPVGNWGGKTVSELSNELIADTIPIYDSILKRKTLTIFNSSIYEDIIAQGLCYAAKMNNYVIGSNGNIYKCTVNMGLDINKVGYVKFDGTFNLDYEKLSNWIFSTNKFPFCINCSFMKYCINGRCPVDRMRKQLSFENSSECKFKNNTVIPILKMLYHAEYKAKIKY